MSDAAATIVVIAGAITGVSIIGSAVIWLLWPRLREAIKSQIREEITPMRTQVAETHKQVTENHHSNDQPTVLDLLADLRDDIRQVDKRIDDHLLNASKADADMWRAIEAVAKGQPPEGL